MADTIKKLRVNGLYVLKSQVSSFSYLRLMESRNNTVVRSYTSTPIDKVTPFIKLFEDSLSHLNWEVEDFTSDYANAIMEMEKKIHVNSNGKLSVR